MRHAQRIVAAVLIWMALVGSAQARQEQAFLSLGDLIERADYIVIASVNKKSPDLFMDGWVKYECRFVYWLKAPGSETSKQLEVKDGEKGKTVEPFPLWKRDDEPAGQFPPNVPRTSAVLLVDTHEKAFNRLTAGEDTRRALPTERLYNTYHLLFLRKGEGPHPYVELGTNHAILPVSPQLDLRKLPAEPHQASADQQPVEMSLQDAIRFVVKDFIEFKEAELQALTSDLGEVLRRPEGKTAPK